MDRTFRQRMRQMNDIPATIWLLGLACLLNVGGLSLLWPVNTIYIHNQLHQSMAVAGIVLMVFSGAGLLGSSLGGWLYDRVGAARVLIFSLAISCVVILAPAFTSNFIIYLGVMAVFGTACAVPFPVLNAVAGQAWPDGGRRAFNFMYVSNNIGVALGTALGGVLAAGSFHVVFYGIALCYAGLIVLCATGLRRPFADVRKHLQYATTSAHVNVQRAPIPWGGVGLLLVGYMLAWTIYVQWQSTVSVQMQSAGYPLTWYSLLWTLNGALIFVSQPLVSYVTKRIPTLTVHMLSGTVLFALSFTVLLFAHHYTLYVIAMMLTTLGEIFVWPAVPAAIAQIAPANRLGMLQGLIGSSATCGRMIGPVVGGVLYDHGALQLVLIVAIFSAILPFVLFWLFHRFVRSSATEVGENLRM